jgi:hypothetical protein
MTPQEIRLAIGEAQRFIDRAKEALDRVTHAHGREYLDPGKETGALRRASMDLTRQLTKMRQSQ